MTSFSKPAKESLDLGLIILFRKPNRESLYDNLQGTDKEKSRTV